MPSLRLLAIRPDQYVHSVKREAGARGQAFICFHHHKLLLLASQSLHNLARVINELAQDAIERVSFQSLALLAKGKVTQGHHKSYKVECVDLDKLPLRFETYQCRGYRRCALVATDAASWEIRTRCGGQRDHVRKE